MGRACIDELRRIAVVHPEVRVQAGWLWDIMCLLLTSYWLLLTYYLSQVRVQAGWLWDIMYSLDDEKRAK